MSAFSHASAALETAAPNQRLALNSTAGWAQHEAQKKREERERARAFDEFRQVRLERTRREGRRSCERRLRRRRAGLRRLSGRRRRSKIRGRPGRRVQREHTLKFFDDLRTQEVQHMLRRHQEKRAWSLMDNTWDDPKLLAERARIANQTNPTAELLRRQIEEEKMEAAQLEMSSRASSAGSCSARRKKVALEKQKKGEAKESSRLMQEDAAHNHGVMTERKAKKAVARRAAGEVERDLNVEYLNIDTRVAKWGEICFHEKDDGKVGGGHSASIGAVADTWGSCAARRALCGPRRATSGGRSSGWRVGPLDAKDDAATRERELDAALSGLGVSLGECTRASVCMCVSEMRLRCV